MMITVILVNINQIIIGYLMDVQILENCVRSNVGDMTFEVR
jgi:hypothetical protein